MANSFQSLDPNGPLLRQNSSSWKPVLRIHDILVPDLDPDPAIFVINLQDDNKKLNLKKSFSAYYFVKVHLHHFQRLKVKKKSQNSRNQGFSYYFCLMIEDLDPDPGGPKTNGFGSATLQETKGCPKQWQFFIMLKGSWPRVAGGSLLRDCFVLQRTEWGRRRRGRGRQDTCHSGTCTCLSVHREKLKKSPVKKKEIFQWIIYLLIVGLAMMPIPRYFFLKQGWKKPGFKKKKPAQ